MKICLLLVLGLVCLAYCSDIPQVDVDLDLPPRQRYTELGKAKAPSIRKFIDAVGQSWHYRIAYVLSQFLFAVLPQYMLKSRFGVEYYEECQSYAEAVGRPISQLFVFNLMYELGAFHDFCTSIPVSGPEERFLGRNLDYGFQSLLKENSLHIRHIRKGEVVAQQIGHAGLIGLHTGIKLKSGSTGAQFSVTLNERMSGGYHLLMLKLFTSDCLPCPTVLMNALRHLEPSKRFIDVVDHLSKANTCGAVYYILNSEDGVNVIMEKDVGVGIKQIISNQYEPNSTQQNSYLVQTNWDNDVKDPDGRRTAAQNKMASKANDNGQIDMTAVWNILSQTPNLNLMTLITAVLDTKRGKITAKVWSFDEVESLSKKNQPEDQVISSPN